jgi:hypothetical protein
MNGRLALAPLLLTGTLLLAQSGAERPDAVTAHLRDFPLLHVDFTQTRTLAALSRPLKSSGTVVVARDKGVIWQIRKPLSIGFVITPKGMLQIGPDGKPGPRAPQDASPVLAQIGRTFQSLFQGQWEALDGYFTVRAEGRPERWKITLSPKQQTAAFLKGIQVSGGRFIERVHVDEPGGDAMDIQFEHPRPADPLSETEAHLLAAE